MRWLSPTEECVSAGRDLQGKCSCDPTWSPRLVRRLPLPPKLVPQPSTSLLLTSVPKGVPPDAPLSSRLLRVVRLGRADRSSWSLMPVCGLKGEGSRGSGDRIGLGRQRSGSRSREAGKEGGTAGGGLTDVAGGLTESGWASDSRGGLTDSAGGQSSEEAACWPRADVGGIQVTCLRLRVQLR